MNSFKKYLKSDKCNIAYMVMMVIPLYFIFIILYAMIFMTLYTGSNSADLTWEFIGIAVLSLVSSIVTCVLIDYNFYVGNREKNLKFAKEVREKRDTIKIHIPNGEYKIAYLDVINNKMIDYSLKIQHRKHYNEKYYYVYDLLTCIADCKLIYQGKQICEFNIDERDTSIEKLIENHNKYIIERIEDTKVVVRNKLIVL